MITNYRPPLINNELINQINPVTLQKIDNDLLQFNFNFQDFFPQVYNYFNNPEMLIEPWHLNGMMKNKDGNDFILLNLIMRTSQVSNEQLYKFMTDPQVNIQPNGGWFQKPLISFSESNAEKRTKLFKEYRKYESVEAFFKEQKAKLEEKEQLERADATQLTQELGGIHPDDVVALQSLCKAENISTKDLITFIQTRLDDKIVMLNTLVAIGKELEQGKKTDKYIKRTTDAITRQRLTHAFAITGENIYIVPKAPIIAKGSFKTVSESINLENIKNKDIKNPVRLKIKHNNPSTHVQAIEDALREYKLLEDLHQHNNKEASCLAPAYKCSIQYTCSKHLLYSSRLVLFQEKFNGDGNLLVNASAIDQLQVFKDVLSALSYLHKSGMAHVDGKLENLLIERDINGTMRAKLSDFGATTPIDGPYRGHNEKYAPYELLQKVHDGIEIPINPTMDNFEVGGMMLMALTQPDSPAKDKQQRLGHFNDQQVEAEIARTKSFLLGTDDEKRIRGAMLDVAQRLMKRDPNERPSCAEALAALERI